jgi:hypothetical protein
MTETPPWQAVRSEMSAEDRLAVAERQLALYTHLDQVRTQGFPAYTPTNGSAIACAVLSDVHCEERVDSEDVPGTTNRYDPDIARQRVASFFQRTVLLMEASRHLWKIDTLCLGILGDIITGYLHDDNAESNYLAPFEAALFAEELLCSGLEYLLSKGQLAKLVVVCRYGNHGRNTKKPRAKTAAETNIEWLMYQHLMRRWQAETRISWHCDRGYHQYLNMNGLVTRWHHGDNVQYHGGSGGLRIPLQRAIDDWNRTLNADLDVLGHFHTLQFNGNSVVNGSVIGYNAYALASKCRYEPPRQAYFTIDRKRGVSSFSPIWTDYLPKVKA